MKPVRASAIRDCERLAGDLVSGLRLELRLSPKPGLVDLFDSGSHGDLTFPVMERSIGRVAEAFREITGSLERGEPLERQVAIGREAEGGMLAEFGANTHKGGLFLGGLLLAARFRSAGDDDVVVRTAASRVARELFLPRRPSGTHGEAARKAFRVEGIVGEALDGLPSVFATAVPAYRFAFRARGDFGMASYAMMAALMQSVEDTTALHRCGKTGLAQIRRDGRALARMVAEGRDPVAFLKECNCRYRRTRLTMGGVADLLGIAYGWLGYRGLLAGIGFSDTGGTGLDPTDEHMVVSGGGALRGAARMGCGPSRCAGGGSIPG